MFCTGWSNQKKKKNFSFSLFYFYIFHLKNKQTLQPWQRTAYRYICSKILPISRFRFARTHVNKASVCMHYLITNCNYLNTNYEMIKCFEGEQKSSHKWSLCSLSRLFFSSRFQSQRLTFDTGEWISNFLESEKKK